MAVRSRCSPLLAGCGRSSNPDGARGNLLLHDENNYTTTASLAIPTVETTAATDLDICWTDVINDLQCHTVSATADLDDVALLRFAHLSQEEVAAELASGSWRSPRSPDTPTTTPTTATPARSCQLSFFGTVIDLERSTSRAEPHVSAAVREGHDAGRARAR